MQDEDTLFAAVLIHSHSLAETAATGRLGASARDFGGIEDWGARLLAMNGAAWDSVIDGLAGAVEVAVVRNAFAHGGRRIDHSAANRLRAVGKAHAREGDPVAVDYPTLKLFRARLRSLLGASGIGRVG